MPDSTPKAPLAFVRGSPAKRDVPDTVEVRLSAPGSVRATQKGEGYIIEGHALVFNSKSVDLGGFREIILPGALDGVLASSPDVRALLNHDPNFVLGRTKSGTLRLAADDVGLHNEIEPPNASFARGLIESMKRGDIDQMSFAFDIGPDDDEWLMEGDMLVRKIKHIAGLYDVSVVTYPAYEETHVSVRARDMFATMRARMDKPESAPQVTPQVASPPAPDLRARLVAAAQDIANDKRNALRESIFAELNVPPSMRGYAGPKPESKPAADGSAAVKPQTPKE